MGSARRKGSEWARSSTGRLAPFASRGSSSLRFLCNVSAELLRSENLPLFLVLQEAAAHAEKGDPKIYTFKTAVRSAPGNRTTNEKKLKSSQSDRLQRAG